MSHIVIKAENLSKQYRLGVIGTGTLTHDLQSWWARQRGKEDPNTKISHHGPKSAEADRKNKSAEPESDGTLWALKDVSFEVKQGEVLGIIGRNGAGKSTLLKILSRVTAPTSGQVKIKGRVASLLEVGTGFHPELTGRENIYLNGSILGMTKKEIDRKFDEIVDFAEVEQFIDTPVKRYSSGMYVRLAFAVAAHLEPEILVVDEVLAVGDAAFQKKCLGKMGDVAKEGRTVLFVSHNMAAIRQLCSSGLLFSHGKLYNDGNVSDILNKYLLSMEQKPISNRKNNYGVQLTNCYLAETKDGRMTKLLTFNECYNLDIEINAEMKIQNVDAVVKIYDSLGTFISSMCTPEEGLDPFNLEGTTRIRFFLPRIQLLPGKYILGVFIYEHHGSIVYLMGEGAYAFEVQPAIVRNAMWAYQNHHGIIRIADGASLNWSNEENTR